MVVLIIFYFKIKCIHFCATHIYQSSNLLNSFRTRGEKLWCKRAHAGRAVSRDRHQVKVNPPWYHINYMIGASGNKSMRPLGVGFYAWRLLMVTGARGASPTRILLFRGGNAWTAPSPRHTCSAPSIPVWQTAPSSSFTGAPVSSLLALPLAVLDLNFGSLSLLLADFFFKNAV